MNSYLSTDYNLGASHWPCGSFYFFRMWVGHHWVCLRAWKVEVLDDMHLSLWIKGWLQLVSDKWEHEDELHLLQLLPFKKPSFSVLSSHVDFCSPRRYCVFDLMLMPSFLWAQIFPTPDQCLVPYLWLQYQDNSYIFCGCDCKSPREDCDPFLTFLVSIEILGSWRLHFCREHQHSCSDIWMLCQARTVQKQPE